MVAMNGVPVVPTWTPSNRTSAPDIAEPLTASVAETVRLTGTPSWASTG